MKMHIKTLMPKIPPKNVKLSSKRIINAVHALYPFAFMLLCSSFSSLVMGSESTFLIPFLTPSSDLLLNPNYPTLIFPLSSFLLRIQT